MDAGQDRPPWHEGELVAQRIVGVADRMEAIGRSNIRSFMPDQHREFFAQLPFIVVCAVDRAGRPWASILSGPIGFVASLDPHTLRIAAQPIAGDPLTEALAAGASIGLLGIDLSTRRRNRVNGRITRFGDDGFTIAIEESFGNCPQYIQRRDHDGRFPTARPYAVPFSEPDEAARMLIRRADTCFVASATACVGLGRGTVDASHRGGRPGFIGLGESGEILIPDYKGNRFFNTLGNLLVNPRAGLLFIDFATGDLLQLTGATEIAWDAPEVRALAGAERLWRLIPTGGNWLRGGFQFRMQFREFSPMSLATGTWAEAGARP